MSNSKFYTKGDSEEIVTRINQVHTITMYCPLEDVCVMTLKTTFDLVLPQYKTDENTWKGVPTVDALNVFILNSTIQEKMNGTFDTTIVEIIISSLRMFKRLKVINFEFTDDEEVKETYDKLIKREKEGIKRFIYKVEKLEMNLSDMFSQSIIDFFNRVLIYNEIIPNSYLERAFILDFKYDDYISFIGMFLANNDDTLRELDGKIENYFSAFPKLIMEQKPDIRVITNYSEL